MQSLTPEDIEAIQNKVADCPCMLRLVHFYS
jgi:hypothetical protein